MKRELVLNELSLEPATDLTTARTRMTALIQTIRAATGAGADRVLRTDHDFQSTALAPDYMVAQWRNDRNVDQVERAYFKSLVTKSPYIDEILDASVAERSWLEEVLFGGVTARGLAAARWLDGLALSIASGPSWNAPTLDVIVRTLDDSGGLQDEATSLRHVSQPAHIADHREWLSALQTFSMTDGSGLWEQRATIFPALMFCDRVQDDLAAFPTGNPGLRQVFKRLQELNAYASSWVGGAFNPTALLHVSEESGPTMQKFGHSRVFRCPDGEYREFSWHARCTGGVWRIHFLPLACTITIGYVGPHLPTVSDPT